MVNYGDSFQKRSLFTICGLEIGVVSRCQEARTILGDMRQFTMPNDPGIRILGRQFLEQGEHRSLLGLSPGVGRTPLLIQPTLVADTERATVVVAGMSPTDILRKNRDDRTVTTNIIMIGGLAEAGHASRNQVLDAERPVAARRRAMND